MAVISPVTGIAQVIQLAVAPVFLLTGVGAMLGVMTTRLARIIDRARTLESLLRNNADDASCAIRGELATLARRARLVNRAITLCVTSAFLVCTIIVVLFVEAFYAFNLPALIAFLFVAAMLALISGLLFFLIEIRVTTASLRIGPD